MRSRGARLVRRFTLSSILGAMIAGPACGSSSTAAPSSPQISGAWTGEQTVTGFAGGECMAPVFQELKGLPGQFRGSLTQSGDTVTATFNIDHTGGTCTYTGSIAGDSLALAATSCTGAMAHALPCPDGGVRDLVLLSETLRATITGNAIVGTAVETVNVLVSGTPTIAGTVVFDSSFTLTRE